MMLPNYKQIHPDFHMNGFRLTLDDLNRISYTYVKEGEPFEKWAGSFLLDWLDNKPYVEVQTSGTTGESKWIRIEKEAMIHSAKATGEFFDLPAGTRALHCLSTQFIAGKMMLVRAMVLGWHLEFRAPSSRLDLKEDFDFAAIVPLQAQESLDELHRIKKIIIGGAKVNSATEKQLKKIKSKIYETYGMTETVTHIAAKRVGEKAFKVLPHVQISQDENKCLIIDAPRVSAATIHTKDVVELISNKEFVFLGRADNLINSGGVKIIPEVVESKLSPQIERRIVIAGVPDARLGEKVVLFIEGSAYELGEAVFSELTPYEKPKEVRFVEKFPETGSGKILRRALINPNR